MEENNGVWRTISGRKVFIKKGQSLEQAMIESGKFEEDTSYQGKEFNKAQGRGKTVDTMYAELPKLSESVVNDEDVKETLQQLKDAYNNHEQIITIYRATPGDKINTGDWIFLSQKQAERWTKTTFGRPKPRI